MGGHFVTPQHRNEVKRSLFSNETEMEMIDESWEGREVDVDSTQDLSHPASTIMSCCATNCSMDHLSETKKHDLALPTVFPQLRVSEMQTNHSTV